MSSLQEVEQRFWSKIWQCTHRQPCKRCCWPWKGIDVSANWKYIWEQHAIFSDKRLGAYSPIAAHRFAYEVRTGSFSFRGRQFPICHQCNFRPCCNLSHLAIGGASDNLHDQSRARVQRRPVLLPDGRLWGYNEACARQRAFYEAREYLRVWAGEIPEPFRGLEHDLSRSPSIRGLQLGTGDPIPSQAHHGQPVIKIFIHGWDPETPRRHVYKEDIVAMQHDLQQLAVKHDIPLAFLCRIGTLDAEQAWTPVKTA